jgi:hypothetical protein
MTFSYLDSFSHGWAGDSEALPRCKHEFVNVSFAHILLVCKLCDIEEGEASGSINSTSSDTTDSSSYSKP